MLKHLPTRDIAWLFIITRVALVLVTYFGYILLTAPKYSSAPVDAGLFTSWNHWDAENYVRIAQYGYQTPFDVAFFPLFPLLVAALAFPFSALGSWTYLAAGMLLSNAALLGALYVLYLLAIENGGGEVAQRSLLYLCIFPTAFFFFAAYNESLFLLLTLLTFLALHRRRWWLAGLWGFFAALTRNAGVLLVIPYVYELWQTRADVMTSRTALARGLLPVLLLPLGTLCYCVYCWHISGNPIAFATVQSHWGRHPAWPWQGIWQGFFELFWNQPFGSFNEAHVLLDLGATLGFLALTILGWRKLRPGYTLWNAILLLYVLLSPSTTQHDPLISLQRFVLEMFPAFITLAMITIQRPRLHQVLQILFPALLAVLSVLFVMNRWMV